MTWATKTAGTLLMASKAMSSSADHKHQGCTQTKRGNARGVTSAHILAAHKPQDWLASCRAGIAGSLPTPVACRGYGLGLFPHSHRPNSSLGRLVAERAFAGALAITNFRDLTGCNRSVVHSTVRQQVFQGTADVIHFLNRLSSSLVSVGIDPNENGLTHGQADFAFGANSSD
jgi:hypothetical protein